MSDNCPVCKTTWTETQLITSSIKHCTVCKEKADVIVTKYGKSKETADGSNLMKDLWKLGYGYYVDTSKSPKRDSNCPISGISSTKRGDPYKTLEESRSVKKQIDNLYDKWKESKL